MKSATTKELTLESSLEETLMSEEIGSITTDMLEVGLDSFLSNEVLINIPVIGTITSFGKIALSIRDRLFIKKLLMFLNKVKEVPFEERQIMIEKIQKSEKEQEKIGEKLLYIIDKCDDSEKAIMIGKLFVAFLRQEIDIASFVRASNIINNLLVDDIKHFVNNRWHYAKANQIRLYIPLGLFLMIEKDTEEFRHYSVDENNQYGCLTKIGEIIIKILKE